MNSPSPVNRLVTTRRGGTFFIIFVPYIGQKQVSVETLDIPFISSFEMGNCIPDSEFPAKTWNFHFSSFDRPMSILHFPPRFGAGFCFTVVYAALLTKTNRISRIFNASKRTAKRPSFITPRSQLIICSGLIFIQVIFGEIRTVP